MASDSSLNVRGTSSDTTSSVTANAKTASLKPSSRDTSWRRVANGVELFTVVVFWRLHSTSQQPRRLIEKDVDEHARHRDVQPDRQRPARDPAMLRIPRAEAAPERDDGERQHDGGEGHVGNKDDEVQRTDEALARKADRSHLCVIDDVAGE